MTAPTFGDTDALERPTFGQPAERVAHRCIAPLGFACPSPGPHLPPAPPDPGTLPAFPDLEERPTLWSAEPARPAPAQDVPEHYDPRPDPKPAPDPDHPTPTHSPAYCLTHGQPVAECAPTGTHEPPRPPRSAQEPSEALPCATRYSNTQDGPLTACTLPAGHAGRHETHTRRTTP